MKAQTLTAQMPKDNFFGFAKTFCIQLIFIKNGDLVQLANAQELWDQDDISFIFAVRRR
jgi:hypothetical protein